MHDLGLLELIPHSEGPDWNVDEPFQQQPSQQQPERARSAEWRGSSNSYTKQHQSKGKFERLGLDYEGRANVSENSQE